MSNLLPSPPHQTLPQSPVGPATGTGCEGSPGCRGSQQPPKVRPAATHCSPLSPHVPGAPRPPAQPRAASNAQPSPGWGGEARPAGARPGPAADAGPTSGLPDARWRSLSRVGGGLKGLRIAPAPAGHLPLYVHWSHCADQALTSGGAGPGLRTERCRAQPNRAEWSRTNESLAESSWAQPNRAEWRRPAQPSLA